MSFDQNSKREIDRTVEAVNEAWFPGAPLDAIAFARFDDELARAIKVRSLQRVKKACAQFEALMVRRLTMAKLEQPSPPKPRPAPTQQGMF